MDEHLAERPHAGRGLEVVLVLGHQLDEAQHEVAGAVPRRLGRCQETIGRERLCGADARGAEQYGYGNHDAERERLPGHGSSDLWVRVPGHVVMAAGFTAA